MMQARQSFSTSLGGDPWTPFAIHENDVFADDDEVVRRFPENFQPVTVRSSADRRRPLGTERRAQTETATAAPGELRQLSRPPAPPPAKATKAKASAAHDTSEV